MAIRNPQPHKSLKKVVNCSRCFNKMSKKSLEYIIFTPHTLGFKSRFLKRLEPQIFFGFWKCHKQAAISIFQKECLNSKLTFWVMNFFIFSADMQKRYEMFALCIRVLAASTGFHRKFTIVFLSKHLFFIMGIYFTPLNEMGALYNRYVWCTYSTSTAV